MGFWTQSLKFAFAQCVLFALIVALGLGNNMGLSDFKSCQLASQKLNLTIASRLLEHGNQSDHVYTNGVMERVLKGGSHKENTGGRISRLTPSIDLINLQPPLIGHVHIAKTGGTTLNANLSLHFERVCGHKGYSYDSFQVNARFQRQSTKPDIVSKVRQGWLRAVVPNHLMAEIGFEDCDWISHETNWEFWKQFQSRKQPLELHVPCRDPVDHLLSQCNHQRRSFSCEGNLVKEINRCLIYQNRFSNQLMSLRNVQLKCFDWRKGFGTSEYFQLMKTRGLQHKRRRANYVFRSTNIKREKKKECLASLNVTSNLRKQVEIFLIQNNDYYKFCHECMDTKNDLFKHALTETAQV
mmetsp:Transcript_38637/g.56796  ORF Transcript_38637/g.56796 Transcript_38637/m.56796 type:complete len:354 (-) Transcript_38637:1177-2238(-)